MRDDSERLRDILEAIARIEKYAVQGRDAVESDELLQTWIVHHLQIIGEAARSLSSPTRIRYAQIPWAQIIAMRNILVHEYFGLDFDEVWATLERDLPELKRQVEIILQQLL